MISGKKIVMIFAAAVLCAASIPAEAIAQDQIKMKNGNIIKGSIIKTDKSGITIELAGEKAVIAVPLGNVDQLIIEAPVSFRTAENRYFAKDYEKAYADYMETIRKYGGYSYGEDAYFKAAECQLKLGNVDKAIELYNTYISDYPGSKYANRVRMKLASVMAAKGDYDGAVKAYDAVIRSKDEAQRPDAYFGTAEAYFAKGSYEQALVNYLKIALLYYDKGKTAAEAKFRSGECYEKIGERKMALETYKEIVDEFPKSEVAARSETKIKEIENSGEKAK
ncbi:MAG: tetratricopeptide repeat protein [Candidatus Omnitrophota bacterium]